MTKLSIVVPLFNEEGNIQKLYEEIKDSLVKDFSEFDYEIILVNDGSIDKSWLWIRSLKEIDDKVIGINLNRNYWQSIALDCGFQHANWDYIISLDADLQNDPRDFKLLYEKLVEQDLDIVGWIRWKRKDPFITKYSSRIWRFLRNVLLNDSIIDSGCTLRIYKKEFIQDLYLWSEMHRYIMSLALLRWYKISEIKVNHRSRFSWHSKYGILKVVKWFIDLFYIWFILKYQSRPLHLFGLLGILNALLWALCIWLSLYHKIFLDVALNRSGYLILGIFFFQIGFLLFVFWIMIDFLIRTYHNWSREKRYIVKTII